MDNKQLQSELDKVNSEIARLEETTIKAINEVGLELMDLYTIINLLDNLTTRKNKIQYLIATNL